jgi:hypothetical protein
VGGWLGGCKIGRKMAGLKKGDKGDGKIREMR